MAKRRSGRSSGSKGSKVPVRSERSISRGKAGKPDRTRAQAIQGHVRALGQRRQAKRDAR